MRSFPEPGGKGQISTRGGTEPRFNPAGDELFYRSGDEMRSARFTSAPVFRPGSPTLLFEGRFESGGTVHNYDVSRDGERFLMVRGEEVRESAPARLFVVLNWLDELAQRVPVH